MVELTGCMLTPEMASSPPSWLSAEEGGPTNTADALMIAVLVQVMGRGGRAELDQILEEDVNEVNGIHSSSMTPVNEGNMWNMTYYKEVNNYR